MTACSRERLGELLTRVTGTLEDVAQQDATPGLFDGRCGYALFYAYRFAWSQDDQDVERVHRAVTQIVTALGDNTLGTSHCRGLAGIGWCLKHLLTLGFLDDDTHDVLARLDPMLARAMDRALAAGQHDFLHEGLGIAPYFLENLTDPGRAVLERVVDRLEATAVRDGELIRWEDRFTARGDTVGPRFNLGLAHGTPAILAILAKLSLHGIAAARIEPLLRGTVRWLQATRQPPTPGRVALYPTIVGADTRPLRTQDSRLGWCYGDLGVALSLAHAGMALGDPEILDETLAILRHSLERTPENGMVADLGLCHGSVGISHIYRRAYQRTGDRDLLAGAERWLEITLAIAHSDVGFRAKQASELVVCNDLLQGVAGIGLGLIAAIDPDMAPDWDRCMLMS